ncbi:MAG: glycosyltransferase family 39 protein [Candidatus Eiseniibacteriota bacterium]|jgi:hypothetical protein
MAVWVTVLALVGVAFALRAWNLDALGLVADEGHQAMAVDGILAHGYPRVPSESIYLRGAPFLYAEALAARIWGTDAWALRFPAALFGSLTVLATFLLARRLFGDAVGLVAAALLAFSIWGLELARYARMYTLLQLCFVLATHAFVRGYLDGDHRWRVVTWFWMALAIVTHQLGVMVLLLFLVPACLPEESLPGDLRGWRRYRLAGPPVVLGIGWLLVHRQIGQWMLSGGTPAADPEDATVVSGLLGLIEETLRIPEMTMPLNLLGTDRGAVATAAAMLVALGLAIVVVGVRQPGRRWRALVAIAALVAAFLNLFGVVAGIAVGALLLFPGGWRELTRLPWAIAWIGTALFALYWGGYLIMHPQALDPGWGAPWSIGQVFMSYPPVWSRVLSWFVEGWPRLSVLVAIGLLVMGALFLADRRRPAPLVGIGALLLPLVGVTFGHDGFNEIRYHFHVYPLLIIVLAAVLSVVARGVTSAIDIALAYAGRTFAWRRGVEVMVTIMLLVVSTRDVSPAGIAEVIRRDYTSTKDPIRSTLNWRPYATFHQDHVGPARFVREHLRPDDRVMVFGPTYWTSIYVHYIGRVDYVVAEKAVPLEREGHLIHHVTGVRILTRLDELEQVLAEERDHTIWLLGDLKMLGDSTTSFSPPMKARLRELATPWQYLGRDGNTLVRRLDPPATAPARSQATTPVSGAVLTHR